MAFTIALRLGPEYSGVPEVPSGLKNAHERPPLDDSHAPVDGSSHSLNNLLGQKGEAAHTIPEECERLFCDVLSVVFLGERLPRQESFGIGVPQIQATDTRGEYPRIQKWFEVLDYTSDAMYRGFVTCAAGERTMFVFLAGAAAGHGLKSGLIALFELADVPAFSCSQIVACVPRSKDGGELESVKNLGWCGFALTTLEPFGAAHSNSISNRWLFLGAEA
ncbi:hypothetical protein BDW74DRAFT_68788 [Aspergillus multicolor]|uniref:ornithine decarboxylase antizyme n=1 Tax=Aspergillus multicolor TaxID=41759 RepID=UPI003CCDF511